ncbi:MAG: glycosyltransferase family 4 protein [Phycisphaeraceae bacterium]
MHILYVSQYFPPEMGAPAARVSELARHWVQAGHEVTVLTGFAHHPTGVKAAADRRCLTRREQWEGVNVIRSYVYATANKGAAKRMLSYASFMTSAALLGAVRVRKPDIVIATSPQLLCAVGGYALAKRFRVPFVFEVRDLWPESIQAVEAMRDNFIMRGLKRTADNLYRRSDLIVTVGEGYRNEIHQLYNIPHDKMRIIHNGINASLFTPGERHNAVRREFGWGDKTVLLYLGTHGMAHALHKVLETAKRLAHRTDLHFAFVGEGAEKDHLKQLAADWNLPNVQFIDQQPKHRVPEFYAACDIGLVTLRDTPLFQQVLPSKIFEYLAMQRPIILSVGGEARKLVENAGAGRYVAPENVDDLAEAITDLADDPATWQAMAERGRQFVLDNFDRAEQARRYLTLLQPLAERRSPQQIPQLDHHLKMPQASGADNDG